VTRSLFQGRSARTANGRSTVLRPRYTLQLNTDETQPLIRIVAQAPTSTAAIGLANGAATGLTSYVTELENSQGVSPTNRVFIRNLGEPTDAPSESGISPPLGIVIFFGLSIMWCALVLLVSRFRQTWRSVAYPLAGGIYERAPSGLIPGPPTAWDLGLLDPWADPTAIETETEPAALPQGSGWPEESPDPERSLVHANGKPLPTDALDPTDQDPAVRVGGGHSRGNLFVLLASRFRTGDPQSDSTASESEPESVAVPRGSDSPEEFRGLEIASVHVNGKAQPNGVPEPTSPVSPLEVDEDNSRGHYGVPFTREPPTPSIGHRTDRGRGRGR
jgi:hypothetical protein